MNDEKDEINDKIPTYSVVLLGDSQVGKTQILNQKSNFQFNEEYEVTMDVVFNNVEAQIKQDDSYQNIKLTVFDTPGQEKYKTIIHDYVKQAQAVVFVYDITNKESFNNIQTWMNLAQTKATKEAVYFLVGNKIDKEDEMAVTTNEAQNFAKKYNMKSFEVSASTGDDISELFEAIANACFGEDHIEKKTMNLLKILKINILKSSYQRIS
jgi:small GTP-binding protein